jgi:alkylated DNA repair dioxygenase AlkB
LIYEKDGGVTYAREAGSDLSTRKEVGWDYDTRTDDGRPLVDHIRDSQLWGKIHRAAKTNTALQKALEQCIIIYYLSNPPKKPVHHHPV